MLLLLASNGTPKCGDRRSSSGQVELVNLLYADAAWTEVSARYWHSDRVEPDGAAAVRFLVSAVPVVCIARFCSWSSSCKISKSENQF